MQSFQSLQERGRIGFGTYDPSQTVAPDDDDDEGDFGVKILFICHGNICRSVAAEMVLLQLLKREGLDGRVEVDSAAATTEEIGHGIYPPMRRALEAADIPCRPHAARLATRADARRFDCLIGMDRENLRDMRRIFGPDAEARISLLPEWAGQAGREIDDPWYTRDFAGCLAEITEGCEALAAALKQGRLRP